MKNKQYANEQMTYELVGNRMSYFFKNGKVKAEGIYENGVMVGEWKFYRETGQLWQVGNFMNGKRNGTWTRYDKNDEVENMKYFKDDKAIKQKK